MAESALAQSWLLAPQQSPNPPGTHEWGDTTRGFAIEVPVCTVPRVLLEAPPALIPTLLSPQLLPLGQYNTENHIVAQGGF